VVLVDDHGLMRNGLASEINSYAGYKVIFQAKHGQEFIQKLEIHPPPDIVIMDIKMPVMNGFETAAWITQNLPDTKVLALSVMDTEDAIIQMLKAGAKGYILKDSEPEEFRDALNGLRDHGVYTNGLVTSKLIHFINKSVKNNTKLPNMVDLSDREIHFLKLVCTEKKYKEIAVEMGVSPRTVDGYRDALFEKIGVSSRTGLVIYAIRSGIVKV
jgi:DNA-binding NarL/FixJ family response regulator